MGVTRKVLKEGNGTDKPKVGDQVIIEYTGNLYDEAKADNDFRGTQFDSSVGRGDFKTEIGVGKVIRGWDEGVLDMSLGEKSVLTISGDYAYGESGFPGLIPPHSTLVLYENRKNEELRNFYSVVELKAINERKA